MLSVDLSKLDEASSQEKKARRSHSTGGRAAPIASATERVPSLEDVITEKRLKAAAPTRPNGGSSVAVSTSPTRNASYKKGELPSLPPLRPSRPWPGLPRVSTGPVQPPIAEPFLVSCSKPLEELKERVAEWLAQDSAALQKRKQSAIRHFRGFNPGFVLFALIVLIIGSIAKGYILPAIGLSFCAIVLHRMWNIYEVGLYAEELLWRQERKLHRLLVALEADVAPDAVLYLHLHEGNRVESADSIVDKSGVKTSSGLFHYYQRDWFTGAVVLRNGWLLQWRTVTRVRSRLTVRTNARGKTKRKVKYVCRDRLEVRVTAPAKRFSAHPNLPEHLRACVRGKRLIVQGTYRGKQAGTQSSVDLEKFAVLVNQVLNGIVATGVSSP